jgi:hypothetical protein
MVVQDAGAIEYRSSRVAPSARPELAVSAWIAQPIMITRGPVAAAEGLDVL